MPSQVRREFHGVVLRESLARGAERGQHKRLHGLRSFHLGRCSVEDHEGRRCRGLEIVEFRNSASWAKTLPAERRATRNAPLSRNKTFNMALLSESHKGPEQDGLAGGAHFAIGLDCLRLWPTLEGYNDLHLVGLRADVRDQRFNDKQFTVEANAGTDIELADRRRRGDDWGCPNSTLVIPS